MDENGHRQILAGNFLAFTDDVSRLQGIQQCGVGPSGHDGAQCWGPRCVQAISTLKFSVAIAT